MTKPLAIRTAYVVKTGTDTYLGNRRFDYGRGSYSNRDRPFENARLFQRKSDASQSTQKGDEVVPVTVTLG